MTDDSRDRMEHRIDEVREVYDRHGAIFHAVWVAAAVVIIVAGLAMTVFPGPATVVVPFGLAMLAVVFGWARRLLLFGADEASDVVHAWHDASTAVKVLTVATVACVAGAVAAWILL